MLEFLEELVLSFPLCVCESVWVWMYICVRVYECENECVCKSLRVFVRMSRYICVWCGVYVLIRSWYIAQTVCKLGILCLSSSWIRRIPPPLEAGCFQKLGFHPWVWVLELWNYINPLLHRKPRVERTCLVFYLKGEQFEYGFLAFQCNTKKQSLASPFSI